MLGSKKCARLRWLSALVIFSFLFAVTAASYASQEELDEVTYAIHSHGAKWLAQETGVSKLSKEERMKRLGLKKPVVTDAEAAAALDESAGPSTSAAPATLDWRNYNGVNYVTPVRNQGSCGSCWAFATTGALESNVMIMTGSGLNLAEQILVSCAGAGDCNGGYISTASSFIRDTGLPNESYFPYTATNNQCSNAASGWQNDTSQITSWSWVTTTSPTVSAIKNALYTYGPLVTTMDVYYDFYYYAGGVYSYTSGSYQGGHAIVIVGYDDAGQYFIVKNSWGSGWGESGYFKIAYSELNTVVRFGDYTIAYYTDNAAPSLTLSSPNGGESWEAGTTKTITWTHTGNPGSYLKIDLYRNGSFESTIAPSVAVGNGSYSWAIPSGQTPDSTYQVLITSTSDSSYTDASDGTFAIVAPAPPGAVTLTSPKGGESWEAGSTHSIKWTYTGNPGSFVRIELLSGGSSVSTITSSTKTGRRGSGSFNWTIPANQAAGNQYQVRITSTSAASVSATSAGYFSVTAPAPPQPSSVTVASPNGGETWQVNSTQTIAWTYTGDPGTYLKIELLKGGASVKTITSSAKTASGSYNWKVPRKQAVGNDYSVRITSVADPTSTDTSNANFTIQ